MASSCFAQAVRFDSASYTTAGQAPLGASVPVLAMPGATVAVCQDSACAVRATTFTNAGAGMTCSSLAQLTPAAGGVCTATSDNQGNFGFWVSPGSYYYQVTFRNGTVYGPFPISLGASAGCPLGATCDASYSTLAAAFTAAGSGTLYVTRAWNSQASATFTAPVTFLGNGKIQPASGQTVVFTIASAPLQTICDISLGGSCTITSADGLSHPEYFGARGDNATASKAAIDAATAQAQPVQFQAGTYKYAGKMTGFLDTNSKTWAGIGTDKTIISFTDSTQNSAIEISASNHTTNLTIRDITLSGPGSGAGTMRGIYSHSVLQGNNGLILDNVQVANFSSSCIDIEDWFMTRYENVWGHDCGVDGLYSALDNVGPVITNSRHFWYNIGGYALNAAGGSPVINEFNAGSNLGGCMHFGGVSIVRPVIFSANCEGVTTVGGEGITFEALSNFGFGVGNNIHLYCDTVLCGDMVHWKNPIGQTGLLVGGIDKEVINGGSWASPSYVADGCSSNDGLVLLGQASAIDANATLSGGCLFQLIANGSGLFQSAQPLSTLSRGTVTMVGNPGAGTSNKQETIVTTPSLATAAGSLYEFVLTNSTTATASFVTCSLSQGTATTGIAVITYCRPSGTSVIVDITNNGSVAFNGTFVVFVKVEN